ncbi:MAG: DUF2817 domain-containing protein [Candidatus Marinimicrobia bacterium]|nr:DUF2817 domain-containing protein [Candidatus Neomarinimicrobiota bacterium]
MKQLIIFIIISQSLIFASSERFLVEININQIEELNLLNHLDIHYDHKRSAKQVHAFVNEEIFNDIKLIGIEINKIENKALTYFNELNNETRNSDNPLRSYNNYTEMTAILQNIAIEYPEITQLISIGQSVQGRELWVMNISDNPGINEIEPEFKYVANMHGDEVVGRELSLNLIEWLCENYSTDPRATHLVNNVDIFIMPSMNPDGFEMGSRYNANGVDLNRDFPDQFDDPNNSTLGRQPETIALMEWTWEHNFILSANMHGGALVANYPFDGPYSGNYSASPDDELFIELATTYSNNHSEMYQSNSFSNGITNGSQWYAIFGGMQDWNYIWEKDFDITLEQSEDKWPNSSELPQFWEDNKESLLTYIEQIFKGVYGVVSDENGNPLHAEIIINGIDHNIFTDTENGDYYRLLTAGNYDITIQSFGFETQTFNLDIQNSGTELNVQLVQDQSLVNAEIEDFESGGFNSYNWIFSGNSNWEIDESIVFEGGFSAKSGNIGHNQHTTLSIEYEVIEDSEIRFYRKVSCENVGASTGNYYDYLKFEINGIEQNKWAGEHDWGLINFPVMTGMNNFSWTYIKDSGVVGGEDRAWIDFVIFPIHENLLIGDLNSDGELNIVDIVLLVNYTLSNPIPSEELVQIGDINDDNVLNILDIVLLVNTILDV